MGGIRRFICATFALAALAWPASAAAERVVALQPGGQIAVFGSAHPDNITTRPLTGLAGAPGEHVVGIDIRTSTGVLEAFSVSDNGDLRFYSLDPDSGALTPLFPPAPATPTLMPLAHYATNFSPVSGVLRVVNSANQNVRFNSNTGTAIATDNPLVFNPPTVGPVIAEAYDRNVTGATQTTLYAIDGGAGRLATQGNINGTPGSPNNGQILDVGPLGVAVDPGSGGGLDIFGTASAFAALTSGGTTSLYTVDLTTGAATSIGPIGICTNPGVLSIAVGGPDPALQPLPNEFTIGKLTRDKKKGTAKLKVTVPGPGTLTLTGKDVKKQRPAGAGASAAKTVGAAGTVKLKVVAKGKAKKKLNRTGKEKVKLTITFTPTGCQSAGQTKKVTLKRKRS